MKQNYIATCAMALCLAACGCTSVSNVKEFAKAAKETSTAAASGYAKFSKDYTDARRDTAIIEGNTLNREHLQSALDQKTNGPARTKALAALSAYATALEALAVKDASAEIKAAALDVKSALTDMNSQAGKSRGSAPFAATDISTLSGIFAAAGDGYVRTKREQALREAITKADPGVQKIGSLLQREFPSLGETLRGEMETAAGAYRDAINKSERISLSERLNLGRAAQQYQSTAEAASVAYSAVAEAAGKMAKAHAELAAAAKQGKLPKNMLKAVGEFVSQASAVQKLFSEMSKS